MTAKVERLINLTVALLETRRPLTLAEIRRDVAGYHHDDPESARRMFERDKNDLRQLGVPIETRPVDPLGPDVGYLIDPDAYALQPVELSAEEVAALSIAVQVTGEEAARPGLAKVATRAPDPAAVPTPPARIDVGGDALDGVADAVVERRSVGFGYRTASGAASTRMVDPYGVVQRRGAWYLVGRDHDRDAVRAFRMDRLTTAPEVASEPHAYTTPADLDLAAHVAGPVGEMIAAVVAFAPGVVWEIAARGGVSQGTRDDGWVVARFDDVDPQRFLPWVLTFGAHAEVLAPPELRADARTRLRDLLEVNR
ncbi:MAG: WYL domain-containing protein [Actinomycetota bacterium]|nr:WYL domain-containing protein [Actinomycetota bacterium]